MERFKQLDKDSRKKFSKNRGWLFKFVGFAISAGVTWLIQSSRIDKAVGEKIKIALNAFSQSKNRLGDKNNSIVAFSRLQLTKLSSEYDNYIANNQSSEYESAVKFYQTQWAAIEGTENKTKEHSNNVKDLYNACRELALSLPKQIESINDGKAQEAKIQQANQDVTKQIEELDDKSLSDLIEGM
jgi:hypothetical protein